MAMENAMIKLYETPLSPFVQKVKIALREKNIPFTSAMLGAPGSAEALLKVNPRAEIPAIEADGAAIFDSKVILAYLEDRWPEPALLPATPEARATARMIEDVMGTQYEAVNFGLRELRLFNRATGALREAMEGHAKHQLDGLWAWLSRLLGDGPWFNGARFGHADIAVLPFLNGSKSHGHAPAPGSALGAWLERANARPSVKQTVAEADAALGALERLKEMVLSGQAKRLYRDHRLEWVIRAGGLSIIQEGLTKGNIKFSSEVA